MGGNYGSGNGNGNIGNGNGNNNLGSDNGNGNFGSNHGTGYIGNNNGNGNVGDNYSGNGNGNVESFNWNIGSGNGNGNVGSYNGNWNFGGVALESQTGNGVITFNLGSFGHMYIYCQIWTSDKCLKSLVWYNGNGYSGIVGEYAENGAPSTDYDFGWCGQPWLKKRCDMNLRGSPFYNRFVEQQCNQCDM